MISFNNHLLGAKQRGWIQTDISPRAGVCVASESWGTLGWSVSSVLFTNLTSSVMDSVVADSTKLGEE